MGAEFAPKTKQPEVVAAAPPAPVRRTPRAQLQRKLVVGATHDPAEREADEIADLVIRSFDQPRSPDGPAPDGATPEEAADPATVARQMISARIARRSALVGAEGGDLDPDTERQIASSSGSPLSSSVRRSMEGAFGADFGGVRVHVGERSDSLNEQLQSKAFTLGSDVFVRRSDYAPSSPDGQKLLAHELAHTVQQGASPVRRSHDTTKIRRFSGPVPRHGTTP